MKILIPSAKEMKHHKEGYAFEQLSNKSIAILNVLASLNVEQLAKIYKIKPEQAEKEFNRWLNISNKNANVYEAFYLFDGLMYRNIDRFDCSEEEKAYLEANVFITTSFYGIISIVEKISEHRLDFLQALSVDGKSLKNFWREDYDTFVKNETVLSLLSSEFEEVFSREVRENFYTVEFFESSSNKLKKHSTISKKARGKFLSELAKNNVTKLEEIKDIKFDGFVFNKKLSSAKNFVFVKSRGE